MLRIPKSSLNAKINRLERLQAEARRLADATTNEVAKAYYNAKYEAYGLSVASFAGLLRVKQ